MALDPLSLIVAVCFLAAAMLYASVGHAGASGYLAVMGLLGFSSAVMRPTALILNVIVALVATVKFHRAGHFSWPLFWPFVVTSAPAAYLGGRLDLPVRHYGAVVGAVLLFAAWRMARSAKLPAAGADGDARPPAIGVALAAGAAIGLLSGLTGVGGGIFLSPLLLIMGWAATRRASAVAALFILVNSIAGLLGVASSVSTVPSAIWLWAAAVLVGGWVGAEYGSSRLATPVLRQLLAAVLIVAGMKMILA